MGLNSHSRVLILLCNSDNRQDYKIHVFHARPMFVHIDSARFTAHLRNFRTPATWHEIPMRDGGHYAYKKNRELQDRPPPFLGEMLASASRLAKGIPWVRVDFLVHRDVVTGKQRYMFGEMTFAHDSCKKSGRRPQSNFVPMVAEHFYGYVAAHPKHAVDPDLILDVIAREAETMAWLGGGGGPGAAVRTEAPAGGARNATAQKKGETRSPSAAPSARPLSNETKAASRTIKKRRAQKVPAFWKKRVAPGEG